MMLIDLYQKNRTEGFKKFSGRDIGLKLFEAFMKEAERRDMAYPTIRNRAFRELSETMHHILTDKSETRIIRKGQGEIDAVFETLLELFGKESKMLESSYKFNIMGWV